MRVHLPGWSGQGQLGVEARLRRARGVRSARANPLTGNVLVRFDPAATDAGAVLAAVRGPEPGASVDRRFTTDDVRLKLRGL